MTSQSFGRRVNRIDELAQSLPPARDLWPAIAAAIEAEKATASAEAAPRRSRWLPAVGMAAAVGLVTFGVLIGRFLVPPSTVTLAGTTTTQSAPDILPGG
jgi:hypothetical protein